MKPSKKSKNAPKKIANGAKSIRPTTAKTMAIIPEIRLNEVNIFAILNIREFENKKVDPSIVNLICYFYVLQ